MPETQPNTHAAPGEVPAASASLEPGPASGNQRLWLIGLVLVLLLAASWRTVIRVPGLDFYQFWSVGRAVVHEGESDVYSATARAELGKRFYERARSEQRSLRERIVARERVQLETYSTPFFYVLFGLFSTGDYERDFLTFQGLSLALALVAAALLCRLLGFGWEGTGIAIALLSTPFDPFQAELTVGNVNRLQLALFVSIVWIASRAHGSRGWIGAGFVLGVWVALKPNTLFAAGLVGLGLLAERRWQAFLWQALGGALGVVASVALSSAFFGSSSCWADWALALQHLLSDFDAPVQAGNFSLIRLLQETTGWNGSLLLGALVGVGVAACVFLGIRRRPLAEGDRAARAERDTWLLAIGCTAPLLFAQVGWLHYYLLTLPLFWFLIRPASATRAPRRSARLAAMASALLISTALFHASGSRDGRIAAASVLTGAAILLVLGLADPWSVRTRAEASELNSLPAPPTST